MEQANNTFSHGLQMDTHPMVQGTDSLTDCLNGTLITMNGNEVILQNDMGNRRVDNAFLPAGYEPVGMKEYGGIIYVAAYNPITNKSQIGSFPSPQRKSYTESFSTQVYFNMETSSETIEGHNFTFLKSDFKLISLTNDTSLRTGDKFAIYAKDLSSNTDITNYNNIQGEKIKSPKNKKYTLQVGVLNSQNEFVDITKTLCRWYKDGDTWKIIKDNENSSEEYKFNQGYFIPDSFTPPSNETIDDANLIKSRQLLEANTYSYKLVGPMYLKIIYNHISRFNYNIYGTKNGSKLTLWVEGYITYNCPDNANDIQQRSNDIYESFEEGTPNFKGFELYSLTNGINLTTDPTEDEKGVSVYDENSNTYSVKIVKKYECDNIGNNTDELEYFIGVYAENNIFLKDLSARGTLNIALLGSGELSIESWRFFNDLKEKKTTLTFSLNAYPKYGEYFDNVTFEFENYTNTNNDIKPISIKPYNGRQTIEINWEYPRIVYYLKKIKYKIFNKSGEELNSPEITYNDDNDIVYWFLTTNLFNEFYYSIDNFCTSKEDAFLEKMKVKLKLKKNFKVNQDDNKQEEKIGDITYSIKEDEQISYKIKHIHSVNVYNNSILEVDENYPNNFIVKSSEKRNFELTPKYKINEEEGFIYETNGESGLNKYFKEHFLKFNTGSGSHSNENLLENDNFVEVLVGYENNVLRGAINNYDIFKGICDQEYKGDIENVFSKFSDIIDKVSPNAYPAQNNALYEFCHNNTTEEYRNYYCGIAPYSVRGEGSAGWGYMDIINGFCSIAGDYTTQDEGKTYYNRYGDQDDRGYVVANYKSQISDNFKRGPSGNKSSNYHIFTYFNASSPQGVYAKHHTQQGYRGDDPLRSQCKVWWKDSEGGYALFPEQFHYDANTDTNIIEQFKQYLNRVLKHKYVYCMYNTYGETEIYLADKNYTYNKEYSIDVHLHIDLKSEKTLNNIVEILNNTVETDHKEKIGNLKFEFPTEQYEEYIGEVSSYTLSSNNYMETEIQNYFNNTPKNIGIFKSNNETFCIIRDSKERLLDPNYVYDFVKKGSGQHELVRLDYESKLLKVSTDTQNFNLLLYNGNELGTPVIKQEWNDEAYLDFENLKMVYGV